MKKMIPVALLSAVILVGAILILGRVCSPKVTSGVPVPSSMRSGSAQLKRFQVMIDWVPSAEYYGFFYAKHAEIYSKAGLDVDIIPGKGAPVVATMLAAGQISVGTTTSDNILRQVAQGAEFSRVVPLLKFNPAVVASLIQRPVNTLDQLLGIKVGTNMESSAYQQLAYAMTKKGLTIASVLQYPVGWGGAQQLKTGAIQAVLAYTTNLVVDLEMEDVQVHELQLSDFGALSYGLVLAIGPVRQLRQQGISEEDVAAFVAATTAGYERGAKEVERSTIALQVAAPTLNRVKLGLAIKKIARLNRSTALQEEDLDLWVQGPEITAATRAKTAELYR